MKRIIIKLFSLIVASLFVYSCQKTVEEIAVKRNISTAEEWYNSQPLIENGSGQKSRIPLDWTAFKESSAEGRTILIVPFLNKKKEGPKSSLLRSFVFFINESRITDARIVELVGDKDKIQGRESRILLDYFLNRQQEAFKQEAYLFVYGTDYKRIESRKIINGKNLLADITLLPYSGPTIDKYSSSIRPPTFKPTIMLGKDPGACSDWYLVTYYSDGTTRWDYMYTDCSDDTIGPNPNSTNGGGGGSDGGNSSLGTSTCCIIVVDLKDPCLKKIVNEVVANDVKLKTGNLLFNVFKQNEDFNLSFYQSSFMPPLLGGTAQATSGLVSNNGNVKKLDVSITLNGVSLPNSSQEYVAVVIIHEAVHAYLFSKGFFNNSIDQHEIIWVNYVDQIAAYLNQYYNTDINVARVLATEGLQNTFGSKITDAIYTNLKGESNIPSEQRFYLIDQYRTGSKGKKCN